MGRKFAAGLLVLVIALGCGWFVLQQVAERRLRDGIAQFRAGLAPDGRFTYATAAAAPLHLGAVFTEAAIRRPGMALDAARVTLGGIGRDHLGRARLRDVHFHGNGVTGSVAGLDVLDLSNPGGGKAPAWKDLRIGRLRLHDLAAQTDARPGAGARAAEIDFSQLPDGHGGVTQDLQVRHLGILGGGGQELATVAQLSQHTGGSPAALDASTVLGGFALPPDSDLGRQLGAIGYRGAQGDGRSVIRYAASTGAPPDGHLGLDPLTIRLDGIGRLVMTLELDHVPQLQAQGATAAQWNQQMMQARLVGLTLTFDDAGLTGHALQALARRSGMPASQLRAALVQTLQQRGATDGGIGFERQAIQFLNDPRHLAIALRPAAPLPLSALATLQAPASPADAIQTLGLSVKAD